jgi:hypothetical protein
VAVKRRGRDLKLLRPCRWEGSEPPGGVTTYVSWLFLELGRLGLQKSDLGSEAQQVLDDLLDWLSDQPGEAYARLVSWQGLALDRLTERHRKWGDPRVPGCEVLEARPRIKVRAEVNQKQNLTVRWYPTGWDAGGFSEEPTDFRTFRDWGGTWGRRPDNELLWLRGVGALRPESDRSWLFHIGINRDVAHSILICAVRAVYEGLLRNLKRSCQVTVLQNFVFKEEDEVDEAGETLRRVAGWRLVGSDGGAVYPPVGGWK